MLIFSYNIYLFHTGVLSIVRFLKRQILYIEKINKHIIYRAVFYCNGIKN